jgi:hypothetical protein
MTTPNETELTSMAFILVEIRRLSNSIEQLREIDMRHLDKEMLLLSDKVDAIHRIVVGAIESQEWRQTEKQR